MTVWLTLELHTMTGLTVKSEINEKQAQGMLADQWRYIFPRDDLDDRQKVQQMAMTQVAFAMEKGTGEFIVTDTDGKTWLIPNVQIAAATVTGQQRTPVGFHEFEPLSPSSKAEA
jgi:hypothetical protein